MTQFSNQIFLTTFLLHFKLDTKFMQIELLDWFKNLHHNNLIVKQNQQKLCLT